MDTEQLAKTIHHAALKPLTDPIFAQLVNWARNTGWPAYASGHRMWLWRPKNWLVPKWFLPP